MENQRRAARLLVECLERHGVKIIFGLPGAKIDSVFDALLDSSIRVILCRHEQNAAFMAAAYGRLTGKPGVVLVTSGPGVSNLTTGLLTATTEGDPIIALGGSVPRNTRLRDTHQNVDNLKLMGAVTKNAMEIMMPETIPEIVENAFRIATRPRCGAVFLSLPQDMLMEMTETAANDPAPPVAWSIATDAVLVQAAALINKARLPVLLLGWEASRPENSNAIQAFLHKTPLATVGTYQAAGAVSRELLACFFGRVGLFKNQPGDTLLEAADLVITVGYDGIEYEPGVWNTGRAKSIVHIDYHGANIHPAYVPALEITGDIATNLLALMPKLQISQRIPDLPVLQDRQRRLTERYESGAHMTGRLVHPLRFMNDLSRALPDDATVISDIGSHYIWLAHYFTSYRPRHLLFSNGQQTLGVALPWAMACTIARPGKKVVSISGDGGFLFSAMELETAVREQMDLVHFVWGDGAFNMVLEQQKLKYHRESAVRFGHVDLVKYAESFGAKGYKVNDSEELAPIMEAALRQKGPILVEVPIDYSDNPELFIAKRESIGH